MRVTTIRDRGLVRLIPATHHKPPSLRGLVDTDTELDILAEIEGLTNARLLAERGHNIHLDRRELVWLRRKNDLAIYGNSHINAAFAYARAGGNRFSDANRGAWYCSWETLTAIAEVAYHKTRELAAIGIFQDTARYVELLADFIGDFADITTTPDHQALHPDPLIGYPAGQSLAQALRREGHRGLIYPSVRHPQGRCLVAFTPTAIQNVRPAAQWDLVWAGTPDYTIVGL